MGEGACKGPPEGRSCLERKRSKDGDRPSPRRRQRGAGWEGLVFTVLTLCVIRVL